MQSKVKQFVEQICISSRNKVEMACNYGCWWHAWDHMIKDSLQCDKFPTFSIKSRIRLHCQHQTLNFDLNNESSWANKHIPIYSLFWQILNHTAHTFGWLSTLFCCHNLHSFNSVLFAFGKGVKYNLKSFTPYPLSVPLSLTRLSVIVGVTSISIKSLIQPIW